MLREVAEEVFLESAYGERAVGLINDDRTPVGQVHLGIVHVFELAEPRVRRREEALVESGFAALAELRQRRGEFETWSQFLLEDGCLVP
jgi:predicted NUDIX family phosphoesterase